MPDFYNADYCNKIESIVLGNRPLMIKATEQVLLNFVKFYVPVKIGAYSFNFCDTAEHQFSMLLYTPLRLDRVYNVDSLNSKVSCALRDILFKVPNCAISVDVSIADNDVDLAFLIKLKIR